MKVCGRYVEISAGHNSSLPPACKLTLVSLDSTFESRRPLQIPYNIGSSTDRALAH